MIYDSILDTIGRTPVVRLDRLAPAGVDLFVKLEAANPMASVKDRLALGIIEAAERDGSLKPGQTVVEATSGNTGIGLAMVCARKGYPLVIVMAENFSVERRKLMRYLGAKVVLTPASAKGSGMVAKARELAEANGWFLCRQFENPANPDIHARTTAAEILDDFGPDGLDYLVSGLGTGGTLTGIARRLKADSPRTRIIACEPENSPVLKNWQDQPRNPDGSPSASHPDFRPHPVQGWSPDFVPDLSRLLFVEGLVDELVGVDCAEGLDLARRLAREEGIFCGISSGNTLAAALDIAKRAEPGSRILAILPDTGERYQSTILFDGVESGMSDEELSLAAQSVSSAVAAETRGNAPCEISPSDAALLEQILVADEQLGLTMFSLKWCEFCWSARRAINDLGVPLRVIEIDSAEMAGEKGRALRRALHARTGQPTVPQLFVGDLSIGGCSDLFSKIADGSLAALLRLDGAPLPQLALQDYLPSWMDRG